MNYRLTLMLLAICITLVGVKLYRNPPSGAPAASLPDETPAPEITLTAAPVEPQAEAAEEPWGDVLDDPTGDAAWDGYLQAKRNWQALLHELLVAEQPSYEPLATANLRLQQMLLIQKNRQFKYLLDYEPRRIRRNRGLASFIEFAWTEEDNARLRSVDKNYVVLENEIAAARAADERQKGWPQVVTYIKTHLSQTERFRTAAEKYRQQSASVESQLNAALPTIETAILPAVPVQQLLPGTERLIAGLAVKGPNGLVYFTDAKEGKTGVFDAAPRGGSVAPLWAIRSENERLELAGIEGQTLILVFNEHAPFRNPEEAWQPGRAYFALDLNAPTHGLKPLTISAEVCEAVLQKCLEPSGE